MKSIYVRPSAVFVTLVASSAKCTCIGLVSVRLSVCLSVCSVWSTLIFTHHSAARDADSVRFPPNVRGPHSLVNLLKPITFDENC